MGDVVSITAFKKKPKEEPSKDEEQLSFEEIMKRNQENADRIKRERNKDNKGVIRSYRLKE